MQWGTLSGVVDRYGANQGSHLLLAASAKMAERQGHHNRHREADPRILADHDTSAFGAPQRRGDPHPAGQLAADRPPGIRRRSPVSLLLATVKSGCLERNEGSRDPDFQL